jgi:hypothetical protein
MYTSAVTSVCSAFITCIAELSLLPTYVNTQRNQHHTTNSHVLLVGWITMTLCTPQQSRYASMECVVLDISLFLMSKTGMQ